MAKLSTKALKNLLLLSVLVLNANCANSLKHKSAEQKKAELYYSQGTTNLLQKDYTSALKNLLQAYELNPEDSKVRNNLGMAYYFRGDRQNALKHLRYSIELQPKNSDARNNLAGLYMEMENYREAKRQYEIVLKDLVYQHQYRTYYNLALIDLSEKKFRQAKVKLLKSVQENEQYCPAHYQLGLMARRSLEFRKAVEAFQKASLGSCVENPAPQYQQALSYLGLGDHKKALHKLREIIERFPTSQYFVLAGQKLREVEVGNLQAKTDKIKRGKVKMSKEGVQAKAKLPSRPPPEVRAFNF